MAKKTPRYDILLVPTQRGMKVGTGAAGAFIRYLATTRVITPTEEALAQTWGEVYAVPGPSGHDGFVMKGEYQADEAIFHECVFRFGTKACSPGYGSDTEKIYFFLEFRGCVFQKPSGRFLVKAKEILGFQPQMFTRKHKSLRKHATVGDDEKPKDMRLKRVSAGGQAGTSVEEF